MLVCFASDASASDAVIPALAEGVVMRDGVVYPAHSVEQYDVRAAEATVAAWIIGVDAGGSSPSLDAAIAELHLWADADFHGDLTVLLQEMFGVETFPELLALARLRQ